MSGFCEHNGDTLSGSIIAEHFLISSVIIKCKKMLYYEVSSLLLIGI
jgi:hypothetical protein